MATTSSADRHSLPPRSRAGFTMVEVIIAIVILAIGVLGLAGTTAYIVRQVTLADVMTKRAMALQTIVERVQATPFTDLVAGSDSVGMYHVRWAVAAEGPTTTLVTIVTRGPGLQSTVSDPMPILGPDVADTFVYRVISR